MDGSEGRGKSFETFFTAMIVMGLAGLGFSVMAFLQAGAIG